MSINGIFPILNYPSYYITKNNVNDVHEPFILSGLKVTVDGVSTTQNKGNVYTINVSYDDWSFSADKRWCGKIMIPENEMLTVTNTANLDLDLSGTANQSVAQKNRGDNVIKDFIHSTILTVQPTSGIIIENNSCINVKKESTLKINDMGTLHLHTGGFVHIKDEGSKLVFDDGSNIQMDDAYIEVRDGGVLEINTDNVNLTNANSRIIIKAGGILEINTDNVNLGNANSRIIIKAGGTLTTTNGQYFNFDGPGKLVIEEGAIIDMPFNLIGEDENHLAILFKDDVTTVEPPFIEMEHEFYLTDCKVQHNGGSHITINNKKVKFNNVTFTNGSGSSTAFIGNDLLAFESKDCIFSYFDYGILLDSYTVNLADPSNPCSTPTNPIFKVINCDFDDIVNVGVSCTDVYSLIAQNNNFSNATIGNSNQNGIYGYNSNIEAIGNLIDNFYTGIYLNRYSLNLSGGEISYCYNGIVTHLANVNIKYCAKIHDNFYGIHSTSTTMKELTIGRKNGASITDNHVAIRGVNVIVDIDAISAITANNNVHHPNDLSGNTWFFDLSYPNTTAPFGLSARGNYWGSINNCGIGIDAAGMYMVPPNFTINDAQYENSAPTTDCYSLQTICNGATAPVGNNTGLNTNFNLIYTISNDYAEQEEYSIAHFGFSLVADYDDEPIYNSLALADQNTVVLSRVQETSLEPYLPDIGDPCRNGFENPALLFPKVSVEVQQNEAYDLIESVSPNPFTNYIVLSTYIKSEAYVIEVFNAYDINGRSLLQFKTESNRFKIDVSSLKPGIYALKVTDKAGRTDYKEILKAY